MGNILWFLPMLHSLDQTRKMTSLERLEFLAVVRLTHPDASLEEIPTWIGDLGDGRTLGYGHDAQQALDDLHGFPVRGWRP